jgi:N-acetyl-gamma-glutamylphosphate reductase
MFCHCDTIGYYRLQQRIIKPMSISMLQRELAQESAHQKRHFSWRSNNMSHYKAFDHQHLGEINQSVNQLQADYTNELIFVPNRGFCARNFATLYTTIEESLEDILAK